MILVYIVPHWYMYAHNLPYPNSGDTVNSKNFARVLFLRNFAGVKFRENKPLAKWQNHSVVY